MEDRTAMDGEQRGNSSYAYFKGSQQHIRTRIGLFEEWNTTFSSESIAELGGYVLKLFQHHADTAYHTGRVFYFSWDVMSWLSDENVFAEQQAIRHPITIERLDRMRAASLGHDLGKLAYDAAIFDAPAADFDRLYREKIREHPKLSYDLLRELGPEWLGVAVVALLHHQFPSERAYYTSEWLAPIFEEAEDAGYSLDMLREDALILNIVDISDSVRREQSFRRKGIDPQEEEEVRLFIRSEVTGSFPEHTAFIASLFDYDILKGSILPPVHDPAHAVLTGA